MRNPPKTSNADFEEVQRLIKGHPYSFFDNYEDQDEQTYTITLIGDGSYTSYGIKDKITFYMESKEEYDTVLKYYG